MSQRKCFSVMIPAFLLAILLLSMVGCRPSQGISQEGGVAMTINLQSSAFAHGERIPKMYTCDDVDVSPPLSWNGVPQGTKSLVLIMDDPDAPIGTWVHWVLYDIPATLTGLPENVAKTPIVSEIGVQGMNDFHRFGYGGPCPPPGKPHRYFFKLFALDTNLGLEPGATKAQVEKAMQGHILAQGQLMGIYGR